MASLTYKYQMAVVDLSERSFAGFMRSASQGRFAGFMRSASQGRFAMRTATVIDRDHTSVIRGDRIGADSK